ncbi:6-bladed beta-propeller [Bacteroides sp. AM07-16]|uniref:6-bladed beta-propeller n=1 Tax=Parabacteroides bouchesdurhonensis TaxID=1936995 RepID=UPI000E5386CA|nr:6-bladed beta-propeller [Parabacteroides bouchesdurhonensis]RHJ91083.1 6-bladed beta-propeller [Bacteroides sp. AM07-16]
MKKATIILIGILFIITGCRGSKQSETQSDNIIIVDVTANYPPKELILQDFMDVEYIPLETNDDFITMAYIQAIGKDVIILRNRKKTSDGDIFFFDRKNGKALKKINRQGQGAEEYGFLLRVTLDEDNNEIIVNDRHRKIFVYDLSGKIKRSFDHKEDAIYDPVYNFDRNNLICIDYIRDYDEEPSNKFFIISKQDGNITKEIPIPYKKKKSMELVTVDPVTGSGIASEADNLELVPFHDSWLLVEPSTDTIYSYSQDHTMTPFIVRIPSIQSMEQPEVFLFPGVITDRYYFMQTVKKEYDFATKKGWPRVELMYDKLENTLFKSVVYNSDFSNKKPVDMVYDITLINNNEIAFLQRIEASDLVEAYEKGLLKGKLKEIAAGLNEESNAVIMLAKYKK